MFQELAHDDLVAKINEYTALSRERALTEEETKERAACREEYLKRIRQSMRGSLGGVYYKGKK